MAKHDQRILKFLNQNSDRAPTITEMMTRLNISISDISDSLGSLQAQGQISKKTNGQGIECWFPTASHAAQPIPIAAIQGAGHQISGSILPQGQAFPPMANLGSPLAGESRHAEVRSGLDSRFLGGLPERATTAPDPQPPMAKAVPVQVQHVESAIPPKLEIPAFNPNAYGLTPDRSGVGILTLAAGLVAAVALSTFLANRMVAKEIKAVSSGFVDRKALEAAKVELTQFDEKTKAHIQTLESDIKKLHAELALSKVSAESLKVAVSTKPEPVKAVAKGKAKKPAISAKTKAGSGASAISKAAARGAAMRKKAKLASASASEPDLESESSLSESSRGVPDPPGLEDLPPPPEE